MRFEKECLYVLPEDAEKLVGKRVLCSDSPTDLRRNIKDNDIKHRFGKLMSVNDGFSAFGIVDDSPNSSSFMNFHCIYWSPLLDIAYAHFVEGKTVQMCKDDGTWVDLDKPALDSDTIQYRIKPELTTEEHILALEKRIVALNERLVALEKCVDALED